MGTYNLPRNVKGEGRILFIFSTKALIWTTGGISIGILFYLIFRMLSLSIIGIIFIIVFGLIGFSIATFKIPESTAFEITKKTGGENIDDIIKRGIKFKMQKNKIYIYMKDNITKEKEDKKNG